MKKNILLVVSAVIIAALVISNILLIRKLNRPEKTMLQRLYNEDNDYSMVEDMMYGDNQTVEADGYEIRLLRVYYEKDVTRGICLFEVSRIDGEKLDTDINDKSCFGENYRFCLKPFRENIGPAHYAVYDSEKKDGKLYLYYNFFMGPEYGAEYDDKIYLLDNESYKYSEGNKEPPSFQLRGCHRSLEFERENGAKILISPFGYRIQKEYGEKLDSVELKLKNGENLSLVEKECAGEASNGSVQEEDGVKYRTYCGWMADVLDISEIESVVVNGEEITLNP